MQIDVLFYAALHHGTGRAQRLVNLHRNARYALRDWIS